MARAAGSVQQTQGHGCPDLSLKDVLTLAIAITGLVVAIYGAVLSTYNLRQARRKDRRQLTISLSTAMYTYPGGLGPRMVSITVTNAGQRPVISSLPATILPNGHQVILIAADGAGNFPKRLKDGESASMRISYRELADALSARGYRNRVNIPSLLG
jgi:hypothetical protein